MRMIITIYFMVFFTHFVVGSTNFNIDKRNKAQLQIEVQEFGYISPTILQAIQQVPKDRFLTRSISIFDYNDNPLPTDFKQKISSSYMVALISEAAKIQKKDQCLEIGINTGYQTAILSQLCKEVYAIESRTPLAMRAVKILRELGFLNITSKIGDEYIGWKEAGLFDVIILSTTEAEVSESRIDQLVDQLAFGGRLILHTSGHFSQQLIRITKTLSRIVEEDLHQLKE